LERILEVYAKRWRVENKLAELVAFFTRMATQNPPLMATSKSPT